MTLSTQKLTAYTAMALIVLIIGAIVYVQVVRGQSSEASATAELDLSEQPSLGEAGAPVQIALFEDFKCPACKYFTETVFPQLKEEFVDSGQAEVYFVNYPFLSPDSTTAALASECVYAQDEAAFWQYKTQVFEAQGPESEAWATPELLTELVEEHLPDIDAGALRTCILERRFAERVSEERRMGEAAGVNGTPSVFVNGVQVERPELGSIRTAVEGALR